jgi:V/A-type H+-transporting ATPase subunit I
VGTIHVITSLFRYWSRNWANIGWVLFAIGGYLYFPDYLNTASLVQFLNIASLKIAAAFGYQLIIFGISISLIIALIQKRLKGLGEIANLVQVFADILSYLRLYALALASSIMAETFNEMGIKMGLFFGVIVILAGHVINFVLGTMGGVIHGLRLNFIEWYHYSFDGGGKLFKPLRRFTFKS